jgi:Flp pilus assembly protein TadG
MNTRRSIANEKGFALVYTAVFLAGLLIFVGLAVDTGRAYVVKAQLTKAVDGAALGAARMLNSGDPRGEAARIFRANFPAGYFGTSMVTDPTADPNFFSLRTVAATGVNVVEINARATLPTTFMRLANRQSIDIVSSGEAQRRMVDLSLVLDVSSSIGARWPAVADAVKVFIDGFDDRADRMSLVTYGNHARVLYQMPANRGFDKGAMKAAVPGAPNGSTAMVEGLYRGWDELRTVPRGIQSGLRVIVLFTDGASNSVPGIYDVSPGSVKGLRTYDFPKNFPDPDGQTWDRPRIQGLYDVNSGAQTNPAYNLEVAQWDNRQFVPQIQYMPLTTSHSNARSGGIPRSFPLQTNNLTVDGTPQAQARGLRDRAGNGRYPAQVWNINNAARNVLEIIADAARADGSGDYPIRIYTIGMGELVRYQLGTRRETPESILMRLANDRRSPDFNNAQLEGKYYFAQSGADVGPAFQALQNQIIRLSR